MPRVMKPERVTVISRRVRFGWCGAGCGEDVQVEQVVEDGAA